MTTDLEMVLVNGERRHVALPGYTGSIANVLARLDDWIETEDGGWVQKSFIVEVRARGEARSSEGSSEEFQRLTDAAGTLADQAG